MSSVECLREFVNERLTAAAEEIFGVFKQTILEYEEEIDRQRRLLEMFWNPELKLHRIELPQQHVCKEEEVFVDQELCIQERNFILDQEDSEPPQIKEEQDELCISQEGEQLVLKQETDTFLLTPTYEESDHSEDQTLNLNPDKTLRTAERQLPDIMCISWQKNELDCEKSEVSEPHNDHQLLSHICHVADSQDRKGGKHGDLGSTRNAEPEQKNQHLKSNSHSNSAYNPNSSKIHCITRTSKKSLKCDTCGKAFTYQSKLQRHLSVHTGEKPYYCGTCGKRFSETSVLNAHIRIHTGEKPYSCKTCGKGFRCSRSLKLHMRTHTGEKPYSCKICGRDFRFNSNLKDHMRTHTGEKLYHRSIEVSAVVKPTQVKSPIVAKHV